MGISSITNSAINYGIKKPLQILSKSKVMDGVCKNYQKSNNAKFIAGLGVGSILLKDGYGCYLYVKQSLNNEKIPSDKRKFVAALDLANGGLMILSQLLMFFTISNAKVQEKIFNSTAGKFLDRSARKGYQKLVMGKDKYAKVSGKAFNKTFESFRSEVKGTFGVLTSLIAASIVAKRVIVPFIATPLADKTKAWLCRNDKPQTIHPETTNTFEKNNVDKHIGGKLQEGNMLANYIHKND